MSGREAKPAGPLDGIRVLDLTGVWGDLAGRILADLGADVLKVEPPDGAPARRRPPFILGREGDPEASLYWAAVGLGKRSVVLDLREGRDIDELRRLAELADVLIEDAPPGTLDGLDLGFNSLTLRNPRLIYASLSPYGASGPKARWPATELTLEAAGGRMSVQGDKDRPPLPVGYPQPAFHGAAQLAADVVIALNEREVSGLGQRLDTSIQAAVAWTLLGAGAYPAAVNGNPPGVQRQLDGPPGESAAPAPASPFPRMVEAADGYVTVQMRPPDHTRMLTLIMGYLGPDGLDSELRVIDWDNWGPAFSDGEIPEGVIQRAVEWARGWFRGRTTAELVRWALEQDVRLGAVSSTRDLLESEQLRARAFWQVVGGALHPGAPARLSRTPMRLGAAAPRLGEDRPDLKRWQPRPPAGPPPQRAERSGESFEGLKVVDFTWVAVGPTIARALADHGAEVLKIESVTRLDLGRRLAPYRDGVVGVNRSTWFSTFNTSKRSVALNLQTPDGRKLARELIDWADIVVESFSPGTMHKLGLDYASVCPGHEDLIMLSTSLMGETGPLSSYAGFGLQGASFAGLHAITGWPDRAPSGPFGPYTDVIAPKWGIAALAAAIYERRTSGRGQYIDLSQVECGIRFIEPLVLDESVNGRTAAARGFESDTACPNGVYRTADGRFVAIAVETFEQWRALRDVASLRALADPRFDSLTERRIEVARIDEALRDWAAPFGRFELEALLVGSGVPAAVVQWPTELHEDPQLTHRGLYVPLEHREMGRTPVESFATSFSAKRVSLHGHAPCIGEHTTYALAELLGKSDAEIAGYAAAGVLE